MSFIGVAINIWRDTAGTGGGGAPTLALRQRNNTIIYDRFNNYILTRV